MPNPPSSRGIWLRQSASAVDPTIDWTARVVASIVDAVDVVAGSKAAKTVATRGVQTLHTVIDARDVAGLRDVVVDQLRNDFLRLATAIGRKTLNWRDDFFIDDYLILRVNFPYEVARVADPSAENPGIGRVSLSVRDAARGRRVVDPVFDPKRYHRDHPPAAWAHGPHRDSWTGHSRDGVNVWWAISDVPAEAGMVLYEGLDEVALPSDPRSGYIQAGYPLPKPTSCALAAGEMLVFDPEILHGTHLNLSNQTRVAVSMRLNANKPTFDPSCFYAREFWRRARDVEAEHFDEVLHLKREDNLATHTAILPVSATRRADALSFESASDGSTLIGPSTLLDEAQRLVVTLPHGNVMIIRAGGVLRAYDTACPHYGVDLSDGALDQCTVHCPGCGVGFDVTTGASLSSALSLRTVDVFERDGTIYLARPDAMHRR